MNNIHISLAQAKAHLNELAERAANGETVIITKHGKPVMQLSRPQTPRKPVDLDALRQLTHTLSPQSEGAGDFLRNLRDGARY